MSQRQKLITFLLAGVAVSLLLVGVLSSTVVRHLIQIAPIVAAGVAVVKWPTWGPFAALPLFTLWLLLMFLIWLYLVGVPTFFSGTFSLAEVALTISIGFCSMLGIAACVRSTKSSNVAVRAVAGVVFLFLQVGSMWVSFLEPFADR